MNLQSKLVSFDIPKNRRDISKFENIMWLGRNLPINNIDNPLLNEVMEEIKGEFFKMRKKWAEEANLD
jgi:hypothetical protein